MPYYAQLNGNQVAVAVTETHSPINAPHMIELESYDLSIIGKKYNHGDHVFEDLPAAPSTPEVRHITRLAFLNRFSDGEAIAIDLASIGATVQAASMRRYMSKVNSAHYIDLERTDTRAGVQALETAGLLAAGRAAEILDTPIQPSEKFNGTY